TSASEMPSRPCWLDQTIRFALSAASDGAIAPASHTPMALVPINRTMFPPFKALYADRVALAWLDAAATRKVAGVLVDGRVAPAAVGARERAELEDLEQAEVAVGDALAVEERLLLDRGQVEVLADRVREQLVRQVGPGQEHRRAVGPAGQRTPQH